MPEQIAQPCKREQRGDAQRGDDAIYGTAGDALSPAEGGRIHAAAKHRRQQIRPLGPPPAQQWDEDDQSDQRAGEHGKSATETLHAAIELGTRRTGPTAVNVRRIPLNIHLKSSKINVKR